MADVTTTERTKHTAVGGNSEIDSATQCAASAHRNSGLTGPSRGHRQFRTADVQLHGVVTFRGRVRGANSNGSNNYRPHETGGVDRYDWQDVQGFDHKMLSRRRTIERSVDYLDSHQLDLHQLPVSKWPSLWKHRMPQKRHAECEQTVVKRQRTSCKTVASWYDHHLLPTATVQHANSLPAAVPVAMETDDEASAKFCGPLHCHAVTSHRHVTGDMQRSKAAGSVFTVRAT